MNKDAVWIVKVCMFQCRLNSWRIWNNDEEQFNSDDIEEVGFCNSNSSDPRFSGSAGSGVTLSIIESVTEVFYSEECIARVVSNNHNVDQDEK